MNREQPLPEVARTTSLRGGSRIFEVTLRCRCGGAMLLALLLLPNLAYGQLALRASTTRQAPEKTDHAERSLAAIDLAIIAAESGIMDVSVEAMTRAVGKGPPVSSVDLGGLLRSQPNSSRPPRNSQAAQEVMTAQVKLAKRLRRLHDAWSERNVDPQLAYKAWKELVLPTGRPNEAFAYSVDTPPGDSYSYSSVSFEMDQPKPTDCGCAALVHWARLANETDDLRQEIANREPLPGATTTALLLKVILAKDESTPVAEVESLCQVLAAKPKLLVNDPAAELLFGHVWKMLERAGPKSAARAKLIDEILASTRSHQSWPSNDWLQFLVATRLRESLQEGDSDEFRRMADVAMSRYDRIRANNTDYVASREATMYGEAAKRAFQAGHLKLGADCLRSQALLATSDTSSQSDIILNPTQAVAKKLLKMQRGERQELLSDLAWNMPALGLSQCARMNVTERIPAAFAEQLLTSKQRTPPSRQVAADGAAIISLLEWAMRDALAIGKEAEILDRIAQLEEKGSDDAKLARLVLGLAQDKPIDFSLLTKTEDGTESLSPALGSSGRVMPLDITVAQQALASADYQAAGEKLRDELFQTALDKHQDLYVAWLRNLKFQADRAAGKDFSTHHHLNHWVVSDDISQADFMAGKVPSTVWLQRKENVWGHEFGTHVSYMMFRYPLEGDFTISFRSQDGLYQEGGTMYGGLTIEFLQYLKQMRFWGVGNRNMISAKTTAMKEGALTAYRLERKGDSLTVHVGDDEFKKKLKLVSAAFPFFGMCSYYHRATTFDSLKIDGDVTIPRQVSLLSPTLLGWSTKFKGQRLPDMTFVGDKPPVQKEPEKIGYDWQFVDGTMESVDHQKLAAEGKSARKKQRWTRREALVQYLRPLCDGEEISAEFYHQPGQFSLAPSLGRIAILLSRPKVGLHWITSDSGGNWTGIYNGNRVVDEQAEQLKPIRLKNNDWNQIAIRLDGEMVTLRLNGEDVYRRRWEAEAGRNFGLFHDPTKYHVRVREIQLRGDWPAKLPDRLFELDRDKSVDVARR